MLARPRYAGPAMWTLLDDLDAFYLEHRRCGELDGGAEGEHVWMACECGAALARPTTYDAEAEGCDGRPRDA